MAYVIEKGIYLHLNWVEGTTDEKSNDVKLKI